MKKYRVNVNGTAYEVELEELPETEAGPSAAVSEPTAPVPENGRQVKAPMPGTILSVEVAQGDTVKSGQVLMVLEAMKMENEIVSPCDGRIVSLHTSKGASVESGALLCVIR